MSKEDRSTLLTIFKHETRSHICSIDCRCHLKLSVCRKMLQIQAHLSFVVDVVVVIIKAVLKVCFDFHCKQTCILLSFFYFFDWRSEYHAWIVLEKFINCRSYFLINYLVSFGNLSNRFSRSWKYNKYCKRINTWALSLPLVYTWIYSWKCFSGNSVNKLIIDENLANTNTRFFLVIYITDIINTGNSTTFSMDVFLFYSIFFFFHHFNFKSSNLFPIKYRILPEMRFIHCRSD